MLNNVEEKSKTTTSTYCTLAPKTDQSEASGKVKHISTFTCLPSRQARLAITLKPLEDCTTAAGADSRVGYDGSINAVGPSCINPCGEPNGEQAVAITSIDT